MASWSRALGLALTLLISGTSPSAQAEAEPGRSSDAPSSRTCRLCGDDSWELELAVPFWIPSVSGSFASGQAESPDSDFGKNLQVDSSIRFALMSKLRARLGPWGAQADFFGASLTGSIAFSFAEDDVGQVDVSAGFMRLAASYRVRAFELGRFAKPFLLSLSPYAGTRLYLIDAHYQGKRSSLKETWHWWDPIVGLSAHVDFRMGLVLHTEFDVGGFGAGNEIAWWTASSLEYGIWDWLAVSLGWTFMKFKQDIGSGDGKLALNLSLNGPQVALSFYVP